jgi:hypothetical protein
VTVVDLEPLVPVAFAPDAATAERYVAVLAARGIEAHARIEDGAHLSPTGSAYGALTSGDPFVYPVLVSRLQRRVAQRALDAVSDPISAPTLDARRLAGLAAFVLGTVLLVALVAWARGDL